MNKDFKKILIKQNQMNVHWIGRECPFTQKKNKSNIEKSIVCLTQEKFHETNNDDDRKIKRNWKSLYIFEVIIINFFSHLGGYLIQFFIKRATQKSRK